MQLIVFAKSKHARRVYREQLVRTLAGLRKEKEQSQRTTA